MRFLAYILRLRLAPLNLSNRRLLCYGGHDGGGRQAKSFVASKSLWRPRLSVPLVKCAAFPVQLPNVSKLTTQQ
jgi:hypothetical protein